jgi:hypothetical protein
MWVELQRIGFAWRWSGDQCRGVEIGRGHRKICRVRRDPGKGEDHDKVDDETKDDTRGDEEKRPSHQHASRMIDGSATVSVAPTAEKIVVS